MTHAEADAASGRWTGVLDPLDRTGEILFGLIMVLTFTVSFDAVEAGSEDTRALFVGALSCNLAWGVIDAAMYLMTAFMRRARGLVTLETVRSADPAAAHDVIRDAVPPVIAGVLEAPELETVRGRLNQIANPAALVRFHTNDFIGALGVFLIVFLSTFPVVIPFMVMTDAATALRASNAIALASLFLTGWLLGTYAGRPGWRSGAGMTLLGLTLASLATLLGG